MADTPIGNRPSNTGSVFHPSFLEKYRKDRVDIEERRMKKEMNSSIKGFTAAVNDLKGKTKRASGTNAKYDITDKNITSLVKSVNTITKSLDKTSNSLIKLVDVLDKTFETKYGGKSLQESQSRTFDKMYNTFDAMEKREVLKEKSGRSIDDAIKKQEILTKSFTTNIARTIDQLEKVVKAAAKPTGAAIRKSYGTIAESQHAREFEQSVAQGKEAAQQQAINLLFGGPVFGEIGSGAARYAGKGASAAARKAKQAYQKWKQKRTGGISTIDTEFFHEGGVVVKRKGQKARPLGKKEVVTVLREGEHVSKDAAEVTIPTRQTLLKYRRLNISTSTSKNVPIMYVTKEGFFKTFKGMLQDISGPMKGGFSMVGQSANALGFQAILKSMTKEGFYGGGILRKMLFGKKEAKPFDPIIYESVKKALNDSDVGFGGGGGGGRGSSGFKKWFTKGAWMQQQAMKELAPYGRKPKREREINKLLYGSEKSDIQHKYLLPKMGASLRKNLMSSPGFAKSLGGGIKKQLDFEFDLIKDYKQFAQPGESWKRNWLKDTMGRKFEFNRKNKKALVPYESPTAGGGTIGDKVIADRLLALVKVNQDMSGKIGTLEKHSTFGFKREKKAQKESIWSKFSGKKEGGKGILGSLGGSGMLGMLMGSVALPMLGAGLFGGDIAGAGKGTLFGAILGGLLGIPGGPPGIMLGASAGAFLGGIAGSSQYTKDKVLDMYSVLSEYKEGAMYGGIIGGAFGLMFGPLGFAFGVPVGIYLGTQIQKNLTDIKGADTKSGSAKWYNRYLKAMSLTSLSKEKMYGTGIGAILGLMAMGPTGAIFGGLAGSFVGGMISELKQEQDPKKAIFKHLKDLGYITDIAAGSAIGGIMGLLTLGPVGAVLGAAAGGYVGKMLKESKTFDLGGAVVDIIEDATNFPRASLAYAGLGGTAGFLLGGPLLAPIGAGLGLYLGNKLRSKSNVEDDIKNIMNWKETGYATLGGSVIGGTVGLILGGGNPLFLTGGAALGAYLAGRVDPSKLSDNAYLSGPSGIASTFMEEVPFTGKLMAGGAVLGGILGAVYLSKFMGLMGGLRAGAGVGAALGGLTAASFKQDYLSESLGGNYLKVFGTAATGAAVGGVMGFMLTKTPQGAAMGAVAGAAAYTIAAAAKESVGLFNDWKKQEESEGKLKSKATEARSKGALTPQMAMEQNSTLKVFKTLDPNVANVRHIVEKRLKNKGLTGHLYDIEFSRIASNLLESTGYLRAEDNAWNSVGGGGPNTITDNRTIEKEISNRTKQGFITTGLKGLVSSAKEGWSNVKDMDQVGFKTAWKAAKGRTRGAVSGVTSATGDMMSNIGSGVSQGSSWLSNIVGSSLSGLWSFLKGMFNIQGATPLDNLFGGGGMISGMIDTGASALKTVGGYAGKFTNSMVQKGWIPGEGIQGLLPYFEKGKEIVAGSASKLGNLIWPPVSGKITSPFGWRNAGFHSGLDIGGNAGQPIYPVFPGIVEAAFNSRTGGNMVVLRHAGGLRTRYLHMKELPLVREGQAVDSKSILGYVGNTGHSRGSHLHFDVEVPGQGRIDPEFLFSPIRGGMYMAGGLSNAISSSWNAAKTGAMNVAGSVSNFITGKGRISDMTREQYMNEPLGILSRTYESSGDPSSVADDSGGTKAYGMYQFNSDHSLNDFLKKSGYASQFAGLTPKSKAFDDKWRQLGRTDPAFAIAQQQFAENTYLHSLPNTLQSKNKAFKDILMSTAIQHGTTGAKNIIQKAMASVSSGGTLTDKIKAIYAARAENRPSVANRFTDEAADAIHLANLVGGKTTERPGIISTIKSYLTGGPNDKQLARELRLRGGLSIRKKRQPGSSYYRPRHSSGYQIPSSVFSGAKAYQNEENIMRTLHSDMGPIDPMLLLATGGAPGTFEEQFIRGLARTNPQEIHRATIDAKRLIQEGAAGILTSAKTNASHLKSSFQELGETVGGKLTSLDKTFSNATNVIVQTTNNAIATKGSGGQTVAPRSEEDKLTEDIIAVLTGHDLQ